MREQMFAEFRAKVAEDARQGKRASVSLMKDIAERLCDDRQMAEILALARPLEEERPPAPPPALTLGGTRDRWERVERIAALLLAGQVPAGAAMVHDAIHTALTVVDTIDDYRESAG